MPDTFNDVTTFGALGNGSNDDRLAIQRAIDDVVAKGGGTVFFPRPSDHYRVNQFQTGEQGVLFYGALWVAGTGDVNTDPSGTRTQSVSLIGEYPGVRLRFYHTDGSEFANNYRVKDDGTNIFRGYGFSILADNNAVPKPSVFMSGLILDGTAPGTDDTTFADVSTGGQGWDLSHKGILFSGEHDKVRMVDCQVIDWLGEVVFAGGKTIEDFSVERCTVGSSNGNGINVSIAKKGLIRNNKIFSCANDAFEMATFGSVIIDRNIIRDTHNVIIGQSASVGANAPYDEDHLVFSNNEIIDNDLGGLLLIGRNAHIHNNVFTNCGNNGSGCLRVELAVDGGSIWTSDKNLINIHHNRIQVSANTIPQGIRVWETTQQPGSKIIIDSNLLEELPGAVGEITNAMSLELSGDGSNIIIRNNDFTVAKRLLVTGAQDFTGLTTVPLMRENLLPAADGTYNGPVERYVPGPFGPGTPEVVLVGRAELQSTTFGTIPTIQPTQYLDGAQVHMQGGGAAGAVLLPANGEHWRMAVDRFLYPGIEIVVEFQQGRFHEIAYKDFRDDQKTLITLSTIGTMENEAFPIVEFNMNVAGTITDHKGFGFGRTYWLVALNGNTTLENNSRIDTGGSDLVMAANTYYEAIEAPDGVLRVR